MRIRKQDYLGHSLNTRLEKKHHRNLYNNTTANVTISEECINPHIWIKKVDEYNYIHRQNKSCFPRTCIKSPEEF